MAILATGYAGRRGKNDKTTQSQSRSTNNFLWSIAIVNSKAGENRALLLMAIKTRAFHLLSNASPHNSTCSIKVRYDPTFIVAFEGAPHLLNLNAAHAVHH